MTRHPGAAVLRRARARLTRGWERLPRPLVQVSAVWHSGLAVIAALFPLFFWALFGMMLLDSLRNGGEDLGAPLLVVGVISAFYALLVLQAHWWWRGRVTAPFLSLALIALFNWVMWSQIPAGPASALPCLLVLAWAWHLGRTETHEAGPAAGQDAAFQGNGGPLNATTGE